MSIRAIVWVNSWHCRARPKTTAMRIPRSNQHAGTFGGSSPSSLSTLKYHDMNSKAVGVIQRRTIISGTRVSRDDINRDQTCTRGNDIKPKPPT